MLKYSISSSALFYYERALLRHDVITRITQVLSNRKAMRYVWSFGLLISAIFDVNGNYSLVAL